MKFPASDSTATARRFDDGERRGITDPLDDRQFANRYRKSHLVAFARMVGVNE